MTISYRIQRVVEEKVGAQTGKFSVYVEVYDDADSSTVLARTCVQGTTKAEIKTALAAKLPAIKHRLTDNTLEAAAAAALAEVISEESL